ILYALTWPERVHSDLPTIDWSVARKLTFSPISGDRFPCLWLAMDALRTGGHAPAVLNAANEVAVQHFINGEIDYIRIPEIIEESLGNVHLHTELSEQSLTETDAEARAFAESLV
ncbi:MAG: 1-deoxy-D-xylulose-5-phosphate reductoisomerase, partial [Balneolaceae bacterium]